MYLTCSKSFVEADYINQSITISTASYDNINDMDLFHVPIEYNINKITLEKKEPLKNEIEDFIFSIKNNKKPLASGDDGLSALQIAGAAYKSYKTGKEIKII